MNLTCTLRHASHLQHGARYTPLLPRSAATSLRLITGKGAIRLPQISGLFTCILTTQMEVCEFMPDHHQPDFHAGSILGNVLRSCAKAAQHIKWHTDKCNQSSY